MWRERSVTMKRVRSREEYKVKERGVWGEREREREEEYKEEDRGMRREEYSMRR